MNATERFVEWLRKARAQTGASQQDVADHVGLYQQTIAKIETGTRKVSLDEAVAIASYFGISITEAIGGASVIAPAPKVDGARIRYLLANAAVAIDAELRKGAAS